MVHLCVKFTISKAYNLIKIKVKHPQTLTTLVKQKATDRATAIPSKTGGERMYNTSYTDDDKS